MSLLGLLESLTADATSAADKRRRQLEANARWKSKNPEKVRGQRKRWWARQVEKAEGAA